MRPTTEPMFWAKVDVRGRDECWPWKLKAGPNGYATTSVRGVHSQVHRHAYRFAHGPVPDGHEVDHVAARGCVMKNCCNPRHLEAVTPQLNTQRALRKTHCQRGHEFTEANSYWHDGRRRCRICRNTATARFTARRCG